MTGLCEKVSQYGSAWIDGELDLSFRSELESHVQVCAPCRNRIDFLRVLKVESQNAILKERASSGFHLRIRAAAAEAMQEALPEQANGTLARASLDSNVSSISSNRKDKLAQAARRYVGPFLAAAAWIATCTTSNDSALQAASASAASVTDATIFEDVVKRHASDHPSEMSGEPSQVESWLRQRLRFNAHQPSLQNQNVRFVGARLSNVIDRDAATLYYDVSGRRVTVVVFEPPSESFFRMVPKTRVGGREVAYRLVHGYAVPVVQVDGVSYAFTGDLDSREMLQLAATARIPR